MYRFSSPLILLSALFVLTWSSARAQPHSAQTEPVAIVCDVYGMAIRQPDPQQPGQSLKWLDTLYPGDHVATGPQGKVVALFFNGGRLGVIDPKAAATVQEDRFRRERGSVRVREDWPFELPSQTPKRLPLKTLPDKLDPAELAEAKKREEVYLGAWVKHYPGEPPVFHAYSDLRQPQLRFRFFGPDGSFLYEGLSTDSRFKYPYEGSPPLVKGSRHFWEVVTPEDTVVVARYPFRPLTAVESRVLERSEDLYERRKRLGRVGRVEVTQMLVLYDQLDLLDKLLHLLWDLQQGNPGEAGLNRYLASVYYHRGCPGHAQSAWSRIHSR